MRLEPGLRVLITGAASGIGRAMALAMADRGLLPFLVDIDAAGLEQTRHLAERHGAVVEARPLDVTDIEAVSALADAWTAEHGAMDLVLNVAGVGVFGVIEDMTHADWQRVLGVNLWGTIHVIERFLPPMIRARRGYLVNVASLAGLVALPWHAAYSTSKFAIVGLSEVLRYDLRQHGIGVSVVCPGAVDTPMKHSAVILGVRPDHPRLVDFRQRFDRRTVSPERVAQLTCEAIEGERFLVFTSWDARALDFTRRHLPRLHSRLLRWFSPLLDRMRD
ncbi:SDR family oxidoreductase [bacterium]|nr:SDR family oxidoreductase [bacterium]